ncbi:MAG: hypothetical protein PSV35_07160 [bacterium]|nr:hypothetical protein [bacterium]
MYFFSRMVLLLLSSNVMAQEALTFKQDLESTMHWIPYSLLLLSLVIVLLVLSKYAKKTIHPQSQCTIVEKLHIHHKTTAVIISYQGQQFLIADNQHALAIHALQNRAFSMNDHQQE